MNLPSHLKDPAQTKHKRLYDTVNSLIDFLEEKFPQSDGDTPLCYKVGCNNFLYKGETYEHDGKEYCSPEHCLQSDEPKKYCVASWDVNPHSKPNFYCENCRLEMKYNEKRECTPHWESDYAAIWDEYEIVN